MEIAAEMDAVAISIAIIMENARVYCCQGILTCHMTFAAILWISNGSWPRIAMISKNLAIVTIRIFCPSPLTFGSRN